LRVLWVGSFVTLAATAANPAIAEQGDPLSLGKLGGGQYSMEFKDADVVDVFRLIARFGEVPLVLDFSSDPSLKVSFKAENLSLRTILQSLADTYGFDYQASDEGVVVRRRGEATAARRVTVGAWAPKPGPLYRLELLVRTAEGEVLSTPMIIVAVQSLATVQQGFASGRQVTAFDRTRLIAEPRFVGGVQLNLCIKRETSAGLELLVETVTERALGEGRYVEEHAVAARSAGPGETLLLKTGDGHQFVLLRWTRMPQQSNSDAGDGATARETPASQG
jgi:hypothetical protein